MNKAILKTAFLLVLFVFSLSFIITPSYSKTSINEKELLDKYLNENFTYFDTGSTKILKKENMNATFSSSLEDDTKLKKEEEKLKKELFDKEKEEIEKALLTSNSLEELDKKISDIKEKTKSELEKFEESKDSLIGIKTKKEKRKVTMYSVDYELKRDNFFQFPKHTYLVYDHVNEEFISPDLSNSIPEFKNFEKENPATKYNGMSVSSQILLMSLLSLILLVPIIVMFYTDKFKYSNRTK